jgi:cysteine desulfurase family protein (TIGR01976 family)
MTHVASPPSTPSRRGPTSAMPVLDVADIRACFPALDRREGGTHVAYFDGPGGTQVPREVVEAMTYYLYHNNANTHWIYPTSAETDRAIEQARAALADFLNAAPDEISFGANMTTIAFHIARALGRGWSEGDEVIVTELDHHANIAPWQAIARERGVVLHWVPMRPETGQLDWGALERAFTPRTRLLAIGAASNALGTINDIARATALAHEHGALAFIDAVHYAPHELVDVRAIDCDFLACSAYKFYGPHIGVLYARRDRLASLDVPKLAPAPDVGPERLETGTQNHEGIVGAGAAVDFLAALSLGQRRRDRLAATFAELHRRGQTLLGRMWDGLSSIQGVDIYGPPPDAPRTPTVSFNVGRLTSDEVAERLVRRGIYASNGDFYAATVIERLGQGGRGVVRAGCACYSSADEVDRLIAAVREVAAAG